MSANRSLPRVWLHQPLQNRGALQPVAEAARLAGRETPGLVLSYDNVHTLGVADAVAHAGTIPFAADPGWRYGRQTIGRVAAAGWLQRPMPTTDAAWDRTIKEAIEAQRALGPVVALLTPSFELEGGHPRAELQRLLNAARRAYRARQSNDPPWFVRLTIHDAWLLNQRLRVDLLNEIANLPDELGFALQVRWGRREAADDVDALAALKAFAQTLDRDERPLILLQAGILGWLALAWGASGLSASLSGKSWQDSTVVIKQRKGQPRAPRVLRYFDPGLLDFFRDNEFWSLRGTSGYRACACAFCAALTAGAPWEPTTQQHALYVLNELATSVWRPTTTARRQAIINTVRVTEGYWNTIVPAAGLKPQPRPTRLGKWLQVL
jgi:hypothetical protein